MYSNFITPPDFVTEEKHTVVLIDADWSDVERLADVCRNVNTEFNVYLYSSPMGDEPWLDKALSVADAIVVNTDNSEISTIKDRLCDRDNCWYYGEKNFVTNTKRLANPLEYFVNYCEKQVNTEL